MVRLLKLTEEQVDRLILQIRAGDSWSNGLVGHEQLYYRDGKFISEFRDRREPDPPTFREFDAAGLRTYLLMQSFPPWTHEALLQRLAPGSEPRG